MKFKGGELLFDGRSNILAETEFSLRTLNHHALYNESMVVVPLFLAYVIFFGAPPSQEQLVKDTIWHRGNKDEILKFIYDRPIALNNANIAVDSDYHRRYEFDGDTYRTVKNPTTVQTFVKEFNDDFSKQMGGRFNRMFEPDEFKDGSYYLGAFAATFNAKWKHKFDETFTGNFHSSKCSKRSVEFMSVSGRHMKYAENANFQMLSIPYDSQHYKQQLNWTTTLSMNIFIPKTRFGLKEALNKTNVWALESLLTNAEDTYIEVIYPINSS
ncbi:hypothetical protein CAEBREN_22472 [Caenorhabditis brenneri]|uniref:Serpin domain-containing protein n=1 Tax=Caenorhabditis brenneri TaxID=135651 RepID=G0NNC9_CAEBE|nr:hypothetical protein CAEBREN_22472 [Caenorhabditis brenneri]